MRKRSFSFAARCLVAVVGLAFLGAVACSTGSRGGPASDGVPSRRPNPVVRENAKRGTPAWGLRGSADAVSGYASPITVRAGARVALYVSTAAKDLRVDVFRTGWYGGDGARLVWSRAHVRSVLQPPPATSTDPKSYMVETHWHRTLVVPTQRSWVSGEYLARLQVPQGSSYVPFVVRDDAPSRFLAIAPVTTWEAYNLWGGRSLYSHMVGSRLDTDLRSRIVSFDRPFDHNGAALFLLYDYPLIRFLERRGYDVTYATNIDEDLRPQLLLHHAAVLMMGHDEYWSAKMRHALEVARDDGVNLAFFGANDGYREIRLASSPTGSDRRVIHYRDPNEDPLRAHPDEVASQWRSPPTNRPENELLGVMYACSPAEADFVVGDTSDWLFRGTGFRPGDRVPGLIGHEYDREASGAFAKDTPRGLRVLTRSPVTCNGKPDVAESSLYIAPSGAGVFDAGTIQWSWGLDSFGSPKRQDAGGLTGTVTAPAVADVRLQRFTANLLDAFGAGRLSKRHPHP